MATTKILAKQPPPTVNSKLHAFSQAPSAELPTPRWSVWRQGGSCRLWMAIALTMNIEPPKYSRDLIAMLPHDKRQEYSDRKMIAIRQYGVHDLLPRHEHHADGKRYAEKYISLLDILAFGNAIGWKNLGPMIEGITGQASHCDSPIPGEVKTVVRASELESTPKGERYSLVRSGALLELLEQWASKGGRIPATCIRAGSLNFSELARQVHFVVTEKANVNEKSAFSGFGVDVTRKEFGRAKQELNDYFRN